MRLEIDGIEADLSNNIIAITRRVLDVSSPSTRNIDITNRLQLPNTNTNSQIFSSAGEVGTTSKGLDKLYKAKIIDLFFTFNGLGFLTESSDRYLFQLSEASKELFSNLNDSVKALPFDQYDFTFSQAAYDSLKTFTESVWVWPIVAMHEEKFLENTRFEAGDAGLKYSRPFFSFYKILIEAVEAQGWSISYDSDIINTLGISSNNDKFYVTSYQKTLSDALTISGSTTLSGLDTNDFEHNVTTGGTTVTNTVNSIYRLRGDVIAVADFRVVINSVANPSGKVQSKEFIIKQGQTFVDFKTSSFKVSGSDTDYAVSVVIEGDGDLTFVDTLLYTIIEEGDLGDLSTNPLLNYRVKAYDNLPSKSQINIFKDSLKITNSIIVPDSFNKSIEIKSLNKLSKLNTVDWSDKFNTDAYSVTNVVSGYAKKNYMVYDNDDTVLPSVGEEYFEIDNEALKDMTNVLELDYSASNDVDLNNYSIASMDAYSDTERVNTLNTRLVNLHLDDTLQYTLGRFVDIDFRALKENYYKNWYESFRNLRIIEGTADLKTLDVIAHDFMQLVYIDEFKSSFFVHSIEDYVPGKLTKVELLKFL